MCQLWAGTEAGNTADLSWPTPDTDLMSLDLMSLAPGRVQGMGIEGKYLSVTSQLIYGCQHYVA